MALGVNTNIASLNAQRNLTRSQDTLNTALQRLSTGLRINSAKDDAAGLAISTRFTTQINGLNQAVRNANDGISLAQTGEAALDEITNNLQRIRELAVQSANSTNSASDRAAIDLEVQQRLDEISRIGSQTTFNGQRILDGSFGTAQFQVGANVGDTVSIGLNSGVKSSQIGQIARDTGTYATNVALSAGGLTIAIGSASAVSVGASAAGSEAGQSITSAYAKAEAINGAGISGLTVTANNEQTVEFGASVGATTADNSYLLKINDVAIYDGLTVYDTDAGNTQTVDDVVSRINLNADDTGVRAENVAGEIVLSAEDGRDIKVEQTSTIAGEGFDDATNVGTDAANVSFAPGTNATVTFGGLITLSASESITLDGGDEATIGFATDRTIAIDSTTLSSVAVDTVANANDTIQRVDSALTNISDLRSTFGAIQSRFESITANLQTVSENLSASRSRILDADFAAETASLTRSQILQQAGISVLSQANAIPQNVLALLQ